MKRPVRRRAPVSPAPSYFFIRARVGVFRFVGVFFIAAVLDFGFVLARVAGFLFGTPFGMIETP